MNDLWVAITFSIIGLALIILVARKLSGATRDGAIGGIAAITWVLWFDAFGLHNVSFFYDVGGLGAVIWAAFFIGERARSAS